MKATLGDLTRALDAPSPEIRLFLLYGPDESGSVALAKRLERAMGSDAERISLSGSELSGDPARIADEAASLSLFGGKRFILVQPAGDESLKAVEALLEAEAVENPVALIAGALKPSSSLLKLALAHKAVMAFQSYPPTGRAAEEIAISLARDLGLRLHSDLARKLALATANDRALMALELEKLSLYLDAAPDRPVEVTGEALDAVGASINDVQISSLLSAVMGGQPKGVADGLRELAQDGTSVVAGLRMLQKRVALITELRAEVESGKHNAHAAIEARGKSIFFRDKPSIQKELARWPADQLARATDRLVAAERAVKAASNAGDVLAEAELILMSRAAARF